MRTRFLVFIAVACLATSSLAAPAAAPATQGPNLEDARAAFASGDYPACLRKTSALLSSKAFKADSPERYDLLMLRGECLLRLKQRGPAAASFEAAANMMKKQRDLARAVDATSLAVLIKASPDLAYRPKAQKDASGISVLEPETRREAMKALFTDLNAGIAPRLDKSLRDKSLVSTQAVLRDVWELYTVEHAATGGTSSTESALEGLGGHARELIGEELGRLTTRLEQLNDLASEPTWVTQAITYRGLTTREREELQGIADYLVQVQRTAENARRISRLLGRTGENWDGLLADCAEARDVAQQAYDRRY